MKQSGKSFKQFMQKTDRIFSRRCLCLPSCTRAGTSRRTKSKIYCPRKFLDELLPNYYQWLPGSLAKGDGSPEGLMASILQQFSLLGIKLQRPYLNADSEDIYTRWTYANN